MSKALTFVFMTALSLLAFPYPTSSLLFAEVTDNGNERTSLKVLLRENKGIHYFNLGEFQEYALSIKESGFGFKISIFQKIMDHGVQLGETYFGPNELKQIFERANLAVEIPVQTGPMHDSSITLSFRDRDLEKIKIIQSAESIPFSESRRLRLDDLSSRERMPSRSHSSRDRLRTWYDLLSTNEGMLAGRSGDEGFVGLIIEERPWMGFEIRVVELNQADESSLSSSRFLPGNPSNAALGTSSSLSINGRNEVVINLEAAPYQGMMLILTIDQNGLISKFRVQEFHQSPSLVRCKQKLRRVLFSDPFL